MISIQAAALLIWLHFFADFVLQSDRVATNKSKSHYTLFYHVVIYSLPFSALFIFFENGLTFVMLNAVLHYITDAISSRLTSRLYQAGKRHSFFVVIGLDQAVHMTCLFGTYVWIFQ